MSNQSKGIMLMILSTIAFALMQVAVAKTAPTIPLFEQLFFRNLIATMVAYISIRKFKEKPLGSKENRGLLLIRSITGYLGMITLFYATANASQGDVAIINKMSPFFVTIFSVIFLKEVITKYQVIALLTAFVGALIVSNPQFNSNGFAIFVAFLSAVFSGMSYTSVGMLKGKESPRVIVFFFSLFTTVLTFAGMIFNFVMPTLNEFIWLLLIGFFALIGQITLTHSYVLAKASEVSIFNYLGIIFSMVFGYMFFGQEITLASAMGAVFVIMAGVIVLKGENNLGKVSEGTE